MPYKYIKNWGKKDWVFSHYSRPYLPKFPDRLKMFSDLNIMILHDHLVTFRTATRKT